VATVEIEVPSRSAYVGVVRLALSALGRSAGLDEDVVDDLKIAVSEACANAVLANEDADGDAPVTVSWTETDDGVVVEVGDRGPVHDPRPEKEFDSQGFSTRSLMSFSLLSTLAANCRRTPREGGGMSTQMSFSRPR
jgi:serine/threonine-protein kinase RsbW